MTRRSIEYVVLYLFQSKLTDLQVHRLGQDREVFVKRLVITNTVEDRILHMQENKVRLVLRR